MGSVRMLVSVTFEMGVNMTNVIYIGIGWEKRGGRG